MPRTVWFPGHMARGTRQMEALSKQLDLVLEVRDARAPRLSSSPVLSLFSGFRIWTILSKSDLADSVITKKWLDALKKEGKIAWAMDLHKGIPPAFRKHLLALKPGFRELRIAVVGTPNVGKSMLLNQLVGRRAAPVGGIPGITRGVSWFKGQGFLVVDSPGILDPHSDARAHRMLSWIASTRGQVIGSWEGHALECLGYFSRRGLLPKIEKTWNIPTEGTTEDLLERIGRRLGKLASGGVVDKEAAGKMFIESLSTGKIGGISLEEPGERPPWEELT